MKKLSGAVQESLVALLCYDASAQGARVVRAIVPVKSFDPYFREIAEEAIAYLDRYGKPPGEHTYDIVEGLKTRKPDEADTFDRVLRSVRQTKDLINRDYVLAQARSFVRRQTMRVTIQQRLPLLQRDDDAAIDEAESLMVGVGRKGGVELTHPGTLLNDPKQALRFLDARDDDVFPLGIPELDRYDLGPMRKGLWVCIAPPNRGKTWFAVHKGKTALVYGKRVLHVTLEMSEERICQRYCQALFAVGKREATDLVTRRFRRDELGRLAEIKVRTMEGRPHLNQPGIRAHLTKRLTPLANRPKLIVKQFPTGQLTTKQLGAYLDHLETVHNFIPDLVLLDYPDLMEIDSKAYRHDLGRIYKDVRGIAVERNIAMCGYSQSNRLGAGAKVIDMTKVAEDFSKVATADNVITYNQTEAEYRMGLARLFVAKAREDVKNFQVLVSQAYAVGQFVVDSVRMLDSVYWPMVDTDEADREKVESE